VRSEERLQILSQGSHHLLGACSLLGERAAH
jgi:hypothetical protein